MENNEATRVKMKYDENMKLLGRNGVYPGVEEIDNNASKILVILF